MQEMVELGRYLHARRMHVVSRSIGPTPAQLLLMLTVFFQTLVERYNAGANMTQEERARLSARRVGLK